MGVTTHPLVKLFQSFEDNNNNVLTIVVMSTVNLEPVTARERPFENLNTMKVFGRGERWCSDHAAMLGSLRTVILGSRIAT